MAEQKKWWPPLGITGWQPAYGLCYDWPQGVLACGMAGLAAGLWYGWAGSRAVA